MPENRRSTERADSARGVVLISTSAVLFAVVFLISGLVVGTGTLAFAWRTVVMLLCYALALTLKTPRRLLGEFWAAVTKRWWVPLIFLGLCGIMGVQLWLFSWAPRNGLGLDASLGFLLMPITLVVGGRFVLQSYVSRAEWIAVGIAVVAIALKLMLTPHVSWVTFFICIAYPVYFVVRRRFKLDNPIAFGVEVLLISPVALVIIFTARDQPESFVQLLPMLALGVSGAVAMVCYLGSARLLSVPMFGLLGYIEVVLLMLVSLALGERLHPGDYVSYALLASALLLLAVDGFRATWRSRKPRR